MKTLVLILFPSLLVAGPPVSAGDSSGDWLPIPDGYVWPAVAKDAKAFKPLRKAVSGLPASARAALPGEPIPEEVDVFEADLSADGKPELFVEIPALRSTGGPFYEILSPALRGGYQSVGALQGWGIQFRVRKNGWYQIEAASRGGGGNYTRYLLTFEKEQYRTARNEGHDFNRGKVTVRKTGVE